MKRPIIRKIFAIDEKTIKIRENTLEWKCGICNQKIICRGDKWSVIKKSFLKRVLHHQWIHQKDKEIGKKTPKQPEFSFAYDKYIGEYILRQFKDKGK